MRARYINEKFTIQSDPIHDMGIGYSKRVINSTSWKVLEFIESKGEEGASLKEIQHFIWVELYGRSEESFEEKQKIWVYNHKTTLNDIRTARKTRGYWNTNLLGGGTYRKGTGYKHHGGLLHMYCKKNEKGKWILVKKPEPGEIIYKFS